MPIRSRPVAFVLVLQCVFLGASCSRTCPQPERRATPRAVGITEVVEVATVDAPTPGPPPLLAADSEFEWMGLAFDYPADFVVGRYRLDPNPRNTLNNNALALVERPLAEDVDLQRIELGEVPTIGVHPLRKGIEADMFLADVKPEWVRRIGGHLVYHLPGFPAKFGNRIHCYVMPRADGSAIMLTANRFYDGQDVHVPTRYDWVIERIIASARFRERFATAGIGEAHDAF